MPQAGAADGGGIASDEGLVNAIDLATLAGLPFLAVAAWTTHARQWPGMTRVIGGLAEPMLADDRSALSAAIARTAGPGVDPDGTIRAMAAEAILSRLQMLKCWCPVRRMRGSWAPSVEIEGLAHVERARATGRGVILWVAFTAHCDLAAKVAWHRAGLAVTHLSRPSHGFSGSWVGRHVLNPVQRRVEDRYLSARVLLADDGAQQGLRPLMRVLADNGVVSITVNRQARRPVVVPFLEGCITLAPGAIELARLTGAALIPAYARRVGADHHLVTLGAPLPVDRVRETAAAAYAEGLGAEVLADPGQWLGWTLI